MAKRYIFFTKTKMLGIDRICMVLLMVSFSKAPSHKTCAFFWASNMTPPQLVRPLWQRVASGLPELPGITRRGFETSRDFESQRREAQATDQRPQVSPGFLARLVHAQYSLWGGMNREKLT